MNRNDTLKILSVLNAAYPLFSRSSGTFDIDAVVSLWTEQLKDCEYSDVADAVNAIIATKIDNYPPTIALVKEKIFFLKNKGMMTETEAWGAVMKAIRNSSYHAKEEWERLPEEVRTCVTPEELRAWAIDERFNESVVSSNFMRSFKERSRQRKETEMLPACIREKMLAVSNRLGIEGRNNEL